MGSRKGKPNKKRMVNTQTFRDMIDRVSARLGVEGRDGMEQATEAILRLAIGVRAVRHEAGGVEVVYDELPDVAAFKALTDQRYGRAPETLKLGNDPDDPIEKHVLLIPVLPKRSKE